MRLLIVTQIVDRNDPVLGFFHEWVRAFAEQVESIKLVGLKVGEYDLPDNVEVFSLGKEVSRVSTWRYVWRLNKLSWRLRNDYDAVFTHMNPEYVLASGLSWKLLRKTITMWYAHGATSLRLSIATWLAKRVFTSTPSGFRYDSSKRLIVGQGIDVSQFSPQDKYSDATNQVKLITVGRIAPSKQLETLIDAVYKLREMEHYPVLKLVGMSNTESEKTYEAKLRDQASTLGLEDQVEFYGAVPQAELMKVLQQSDIFVSDGATGSLDKALLEAMATRLMVISSNESFGKIVPEPGLCTFASGDSQALSERLAQYLELPEKEQARMKDLLRNEVTTNHSLATFADKIILGIKEIS